MLKLTKHAIIYLFSLNQIVIKKNYFWKGKRSLGHKCILNHFNLILSTNCEEDGFLQLEVPNFQKIVFAINHLS